MGRERKYSHDELVAVLEAAMGKTLGEVDINHVFDKTITHPKITGIAGDVVEQSILGFDADSKAEPDIDVDGELVELKTTGIRREKTDSKSFEAKEPVSVTAVSPDTIVTEEFYNSRFWHKIRKMLFVYYEYASNIPVPARDYMNFMLMGYDFYEFNKYDRRILKTDWELVRDFLIELREQPGFDEIEYARLSHELRDRLMYIDTAPKWPNPPRFRLKRSLVTQIVQQHFKKHSIDELDIGGISELDKICRTLESQYRGKTLQQLAKLLNVQINYDKNGNVNKSISERVVVKMLGGNRDKINSLDIFKKAGIIGKTIVFSNKGGRTEDTKLFRIDFDEWLDRDAQFEDSQIYDYFANHQFLCIQFKETIEGEILQSKFVGFKRLVFSQDFIDMNARYIWDSVRDTVFSGQLRESYVLDKNGNRIPNRAGTYKTFINFPKSSDRMKLFVRGGGEDSTKKTLNLCGIQMYTQFVWIRGEDIIDLLSK